jgi:hypothetical protein
MALTVTGTATYARFALLEIQVRVLLRETVGASDDALAKVSKGLADPHYIEKVTVYGLFRNGTIGAMLRLEIDWRRYSVAVKAGGRQLQVPDAWRDAVAPSLQEAVRTFNDAVRVASLGTEWVVTYAPHFNGEQVNSYLGLITAPKRQWARKPDEATFGFGPLEEASLVIGLAVD